jgi:ribose transport system permease protein
VLMSPAATASIPYFVRKNRNELLTVVLFVLLFFVVNGPSLGSFGYSDLRDLSGTATTLALAAMGQTFAILTGGFDLSAGSTVSLVNVVVASMMTDSPFNQVGVALLGVAVGSAVGATNGFFIAFMRMQPIVVTLASLFIVQGLALLIRPTPGGYVPQSFMDFLAGTAVPKLLPSSLLLLLIAIALWFLIKNSRLGTSLYAVGSDEQAALAAGIRTRRTKLVAYTLAGGFYGSAGVFLSAQSGGSDPLVGSAMLLQIFSAVVLGGTALGGGRGGLVGSVVGSYVLLMFVNVLFLLNLPADLATVAEGLVLIFAVMFGAMGSGSSAFHNIRLLFYQVAGHRRNSHLSSLRPSARFRELRARSGASAQAAAPWLTRHREAIQFAAPSYMAFILVVLVTVLYLSHVGQDYVRSLLTNAAFLGILAFGQTVVVLTGGLDLSLPWAVTLCAVLFAGVGGGDNSALLWSVPLVLGCGALIGALNGTGVAILALPPIVMTIAANGILQGLTLLYTQGSPSGFAPSLVKWLANGTLLGINPVVWAFAVFIVLTTILLRKTRLGRQIYAIGNGARVANLSGIDVRATTICAYIISGLCSALTGILLVGYNGQASLGMGDDYLLPSIAVVVAGGVPITGGRGDYLGTVGGVLLLTSLQILLSGTTLPDALRGIIFGMVVLGALLALQWRRAV